MVKNPPAMRETWIRFLGWEDPGKTKQRQITFTNYYQTKKLRITKSRLGPWKLQSNYMS